MSVETRQNADNFIPIEIARLRNTMREINFDLYLKISEDNFAHVFSKNSGIDYRRLAQYISKGVIHLYLDGWRNRRRVAWERWYRGVMGDDAAHPAE